MTLIREYKQPTTPEEIKFGRLDLACRSKGQNGQTKVSEYEVKVFRVALGEDDKLHMLDAIGSAGEILSLRASLGKSVNAKLKFYGCGRVGSYRAPEKVEAGYRFYTEAVGGLMGGRQMVHFIAISNHPGFMPYVNPLALAKCLASNAFTTPFLCPHLHGEGTPDWMPYITEQLLQRNALRYLDCFNCNAGILMQRENEIENVISEGVKGGHLPWVPHDLDEIKAAVRAARKKSRPAVGI